MGKNTNEQIMYSKPRPTGPMLFDRHLHEIDQLWLPLGSKAMELVFENKEKVGGFLSLNIFL